MVVPWPIEEEREMLSFRIGGLVRLRARSPRTGKVHDFYEMRFTDWTNVIPVTEDGQVILIRQFRAGARQVTLEIPGGLVEPGESPLDAAQRELREETGYSAVDWTPLGSVQPNPAIQSNRCHTFLARGAVKSGAMALEPMEDIELEPVPLAAVPGLIARGEIEHTLVISAFVRLMLAGGVEREWTDTLARAAAAAGAGT
ncbi:MAG: NUDIX hydrolase [Deltaproteobacteria bacterium]|nr:NUDIX hydrolase [Deltaproteobacteria bacterium]